MRSINDFVAAPAKQSKANSQLLKSMFYEMMSQPVEFMWGWGSKEVGEEGQKNSLSQVTHQSKQLHFLETADFGPQQNRNCSLLTEQNKGAGSKTLLKTGRRFGNNHGRASKPLCSWDPSAELQNILPTLHPPCSSQIACPGSTTGSFRKKP